MSDKASSFQCFNCRKKLPAEERGRIPLIAVALASVALLFLAHYPRGPSEVCKDCSSRVYLFAALTSVIAAIILYVAC